MGDLVLFKASVPNTYLAGQVSLRVGWGKPRKRANEEPAIEGPTRVCECGRVRAAKKKACTRCVQLEALQENPLRPAVIRALYELGGSATIAQLNNMIEAAPSEVSAVARHLVVIGICSRRQRVDARSVRWIYSIKES